MEILLRSSALNNIPTLKMKEKIASIFEACEICSKRDIKVKKEVDGSCPRCTLTVIAYNRYAESNLPIEYWPLKMEKDFIGDKRLLTKYNEYIADLKKSYVNGASVCFAGFHGLGKTLTCCCILKKACQHGFSCLYTTLSDIVSVLTQAPGEEKFLARKELLMVDYLVIDEFDNRFFSTENAADLYARTLEGIFRTRAGNKLPTFLCTNSPNVVETFNGPLKQSIESLMKGYLETFIVLGEDFRGKKGNV
jgi:DNA replication protein DnaC